MKKPISSKILVSLALSSLLLGFTSCGEDVGYTYSSYHCNLTIDNSTHQDPTLGSAMNALSPGIFCKIGFDSNGADKFVFTNNQGQSTTTPFNAIDERLESQLHIGLNQGVYVGFGNLDNPATFYAYDAECPNCFSATALPLRSYQISVSQTGIATCSRCKRTYNMNTGGNILSGETGKPLTQYRATTTGAYGLLRIY